MVLIRNVRVVDGAGKPPFVADILVKGDRISAIGSFPRKRADVVIDGLGAYLMPGFIDVDATADHYLTLLTRPDQRTALLGGVTTLIGGQCGSSLAPLLYGSLESIDAWADPRLINVNWHTVSEFFRTLRKRGIGVNFGTLVGHSTVRRALIGDCARDLTAEEIKVFRRILARAMEEGALGFSTGLGYAESHAVPYSELKALAEVVAREGGVYATHLRDEKEEIVRSVHETIRLAEETRVRALISHLRPLLGFERDFESALAMIEASDADLHFDAAPFDASIIPIYTLLPRFAQQGGWEEMRSYIREPHLERRLLSAFPHIRGDDCAIVHAPGAEYLAGKTLGSFSENRELPPGRALLELMRITNLRALLRVRNVNVDWAVKSLSYPRALVGSNDSHPPEEISASSGNGSAHHAFPYALMAVTGTRMMKLEDMVRKMTSVPAQKFRLVHRGEIKEGFFADLVLMSEERILHVFVNGTHAVQDGFFKAGIGGTILTRR